MHFVSVDGDLETLSWADNPCRFSSAAIASAGRRAGGGSTLVLHGVATTNPKQPPRGLHETEHAHVCFLLVGVQ